MMKETIISFPDIAMGVSMPPLLVVKGEDAAKGYSSNSGSRLSQAAQGLEREFSQVPIIFHLSGMLDVDGFKLPTDPIISIEHKNIIVRRYVAKSNRRGSIKERWSMDDYDISISGVLMSDEHHEVDYYVKELRRYAEAKESIAITCDYLNTQYGIDRICIESISFPFTKGMENQMFTIKAYSDDLYDLLEEVNHV